MNGILFIFGTSHATLQDTFPFTHLNREQKRTQLSIRSNLRLISLSLSLSLTNLPSMNSQCSTFTLLHSCVLIASVNVANNETQKCIYGKVIQNIQCHGTIIFSFEHIPCFIFGIYFTAFLMCGSFRLKLKPI